MQERPTYLYHYTSISTLALILANQTIRFNALTAMDDKQECRSADLKNAGSFVYVSCWTADSEERIPMWNMYAGLEAGVRIGMPASPFERYNIPYSQLKSILPYDLITSYGQAVCKSILPWDTIRQGILPLNGFFPDLTRPVKVQYKDDPKLLEPHILTPREDGKMSTFPYEFGTHKNTGWEFQKEWRYILRAIPFVPKTDANPNVSFTNTVGTRFMSDKLVATRSYFDLKLRKDAIDRMEIMPSPAMNAGNTLLLNALLKEHGMEDMMRTSKYTGLL